MRACPKEREKTMSENTGESKEKILDESDNNAKIDLIHEALKNVIDPEIHHDIVELGLVYDIAYDSTTKESKIEMTLTSPMCPFGPAIIEQTRAEASRVEGVDSVDVQLVWEPAWDPRIMASEEIKIELGIW